MKRKSSILTRRNLLQGTAAILAAAVAPRSVSAQASPPQIRSSTGDVMDELSKYMADAKSRFLPLGFDGSGECGSVAKLAES